MVKLVFCVRRRPEMSREEFQRYWREVHGPLVAGHANVLGMTRYVQSHTVATTVDDALRSSRGGPEPFDGIAEVWFEDADAIASASATTGGRAAARALLEDERRFIDLAHSPLWIVEEHEVVGPR